MSLKPITLYTHGLGPNPWKVVMLLQELGIPYTDKYMEFPDMKKEPFESVNPNGRVPAIEDPNTGISLWESGAILEYLIETYDKENKLSFAPGSKDYFHAKQWLHYQMSGQGPYFGQAVWFTRFHPEKLDSARERYVSEVRRVSGVMDKYLADKEYLVGGKFSYADIAFIPWFLFLSVFEVDAAKDFPNLDAWLKRLQARPAIAKSMKLREESIAAHS